MLEGKCLKCGTRYFGWALRFPRHQVCSKCGVGLDIIEDGRQVSKGYSPFSAPEHSVDSPSKAASLDSGEKEPRLPKE